MGSQPVQQSQGRCALALKTEARTALADGRNPEVVLRRPIEDSETVEDVLDEWEAWQPMTDDEWLAGWQSERSGGPSNQPGWHMGGNGRRWMFSAVRRYFRYRNVLIDLATLFFPAKPREIRRAMSFEIDEFVRIGLLDNWNSETTAAVIGTLGLLTVIQEMDPIHRERVFDQLQAEAAGTRKGAEGLIDEANWLRDVGSKDQAASLDPVHFRFAMMSCLMTRWLFDKRIDPYTKSMFLTVTSQALAGHDPSAVIDNATAMIQKVVPPRA